MSIKTAQTDHPIEERIARRWSPYGWADRTVSESDLRSLFEAARWAPSSYNEQPWRWIVARREDEAAFAKLLSTLVEGNRTWARHAPVLAIGVTIRTFTRNGKPNKAYQHDLGIAAATLTAEATARGLHVHQMIGIQPDRVRELYGLPEEAEPLTALAIGYAGEPEGLADHLLERDRAPRTRKPLSDLVFGERWGESADFVPRQEADSRPTQRGEGGSG